MEYTSTRISGHGYAQVHFPPLCYHRPTFLIISSDRSVHYSNQRARALHQQKSQDNNEKWKRKVFPHTLTNLISQFHDNFFQFRNKYVQDIVEVEKYPITIKAGAITQAIWLLPRLEFVS